MFQSLRQNSQIYIFYKGNNPILKVGTITNIPTAKPKYAVPTTFGQPQELVVDLVVKLDNQIVNYTGLPATLDIADSYSNGENIVISDSKEAMNAEILSYKQKSVDTINSIELHQHIVTSCDDILNNLNPEYAEKKQQQDEIQTLKNQMLDVSKNLAALTEMIGTLTRKGTQDEQNVGNKRKGLQEQI